MKKDSAEEHLKLQAILHILEDRYPHAVSGLEIASLVDLSAEKVGSFLGFLAKYSFITYNETEKTALIRADFSALE
ncbi:MAG: hypothetical protein EFT35_01335 [Methanophagales archaeon ANME-1-THS]|nr:MAG: hypothetical protein EFT35_01335 [Methanophagales archaeon ANME-1-THS]